MKKTYHPLESIALSVVYNALLITWSITGQTASFIQLSHVRMASHRESRTCKCTVHDHGAMRLENIMDALEISSNTQ